MLYIPYTLYTSHTIHIYTYTSPIHILLYTHTILLTYHILYTYIIIPHTIYIYISYTYTQTSPSHGLQTNVLYFSPPDEDFPSLVRSTTFTNLNSKTLDLEVCYTAICCAMLLCVILLLLAILLAVVYCTVIS